MDSIAKFAEVCQRAARTAGEVLLQWRGRAKVSEKAPADLVTEADLVAQEAIQDTILREFPDHAILGEEGVVASSTGSEYRWIVDPLDGTTNYVHQVPHYSVSIALERAGQLLVAAILEPFFGECFTATAGCGAFLGKHPIHSGRVTELSDSLAAVGLPPRARDDSPDVQFFLQSVTHCQAIRRTGSAALNFAYLAAGRFDLFACFSTKIWDVAAGILIAREAGAMVTAPDGGELSLESGQFLASANRQLHEQALQMLRPIVGDGGK